MTSACAMGFPTFPSPAHALNHPQTCSRDLGNPRRADVDSAQVENICHYVEYYSIVLAAAEDL